MENRGDKRIDSARQPVVGVNKYRLDPLVDGEEKIDVLKVDNSAVRTAQLAKLQARPESPEALAWRRAMGAKGWGTPTWPAKYGGGGLSREQARVLLVQCHRHGQNPSSRG